MRRANLLSAICSTILFVGACGNSETQDISSVSTQTTANPLPNFIVMIGDDMAVETLSCYGVGNTAAVTPNLDKMCAQGLRFDNFWTQPVCSPTRATILTGRYGFRTGVGIPVAPIKAPFRVPEKTAAAHKELPGGPPRSKGKRIAPGLRADEFTLPMALKAGTKGAYDMAAFGKWHLGDDSNGSINHPNLAGFEQYSGNVRSGGVESYFAWSKVINGEVTDGSTVWADSDKVNDAINWLDMRDSDKPYFMWVAFNAPHTLFHLPPVDLLNSDAKLLDPDAITTENQHAYYNAMIEALDTEIGRLLAHLTPEERNNTYVMFLGDNGTPEQVAMSPFDADHSKGTLTQGGINVPFFVTGPGIESGATAALANSVDIYATMLELAGADIEQTLPRDRVFDTVSLAPVLQGKNNAIRDFTYADVFGVTPRGNVNDRAIRNETYKYLVVGKKESLFNLDADPYEKNNLLTSPLSDEGKANLASLKAKMAELLDSE